MIKQVNKLLLPALVAGLLSLTFCGTVTETRGPLKALEGNWKIKSFRFAAFSAMSKEQAQEWVGKQARFQKKQIYFEYIKIPSYRKVFLRDSVCRLNSVSRSSQSSKEYMQKGFKTDPNPGRHQFG